jgi:dGTPase
MNPLAPYAAQPQHSRGRLHATAPSHSRSPRDCFQRDRDRIIHSIAFRRLRHKTQVFVAPDDDHFRVRLTHSLEVAQIARTIARALQLNEDLTEAIALAHDIGHPPFGHAGEEGLKTAMAPYGGWDHNAHSIRIVTQLEQAYPDAPGLNLTWECLEGLAKHNGPVLAPSWALVEYNHTHNLELHTWPSLEAQVAAIADDIAYNNHDIDDGLRSGVLLLQDILTVPFVAQHWAAVLERHPHALRSVQIRELVRDMIGSMVADVLDHSAARIAQTGVRSCTDVRAQGAALIGFSPAMAAHERAMKAMLYAKLYYAPKVQAVADRGQEIAAALFAAYWQQPMFLPQEWQDVLQEQEETARARTISDFIAGMTDRYAIAAYTQYIGAPNVPAGF